MTLADKLAAIIRQRYDQSPPGKWPMEDSLAEFIIEHAAAAGFEFVEVPEGTYVSVRWDRDAQIAMLNAAEQPDL